MATGQGTINVTLGGDYTISTYSTLTIPVGASIDIYVYPLGAPSGTTGVFNPTECAILKNLVSVSVLTNDGAGNVTVSAASPGLRLIGTLTCRYVWADYP